MIYKNSSDLSFKNTVFAKTSPELMTLSELASSCGKMSSEMHLAQAELFKQNNITSEVMETLSVQTSLWYTKAVLSSLEDCFNAQPPEARQIILSYLFDAMFSGNRSVCEIAAQAAGRIIAHACETDMQVWSDFLRKALFVKNNEAIRGLSFSEDPLRTAFLTVYRTVKEQYRKPVLAAYATYFKSSRWDTWTCLRLLTGILDIPVKEWGAMQRGNIGGFIRYFLRKPDPEVRIASFYLLREWLSQDWKPSEDFRGYLAQSFSYILENDPDVSPAEKSLIRFLAESMDVSLNEEDFPVPRDRVLFADNLRANHSWLYKLENLRILKEKHSGPQDELELSSYASHLLVLLRLNSEETVFHQAGEDILDIADRLSDSQNYEIAKELLKVIETGYDATGYVPSFLGRFFNKVSSQLQSDLLKDIRTLCGSHNAETVGNALETICFIASGLSGEGHSETDHNTVKSLCGMLSQSLYSDLEDVVRHLLYSIGTELYAKLNSPEWATDEINKDRFADLAHNVIISLKDGSHADLLCHPGAVEEIAKWLASFSSTHPDVKRPVAFYSGTFDPFANGHHAIVQELAEMGYQVYVNVHDFAWGRNIQPLLLRRQIAAMSVTDVAHVFVFPEEITINTDNYLDLARLNALFPDQKVWLVVRNALVESEPVYQETPFEGSIHSFPHLVFVRNESLGYHDEANSSGYLTGDVISFRLPVYYEHMTAEEVRQNMLEGKSIDGLVAPQVVNYINRHNMYAEVSDTKSELAHKSIETDYSSNGCRILLIKNGAEVFDGRIDFHEIENDRGTVLFDKLSVPENPEEYHLDVLLDETLVNLQSNGIRKAICPEGIIDEALLRRKGFIKDPENDNMTVILENPVVVFTNIIPCITDTFAGDRRILDLCHENAYRLQEAAAGLFPGNLVLNINSDVMYYRLSEKIQENCIGSSTEKVCVPFAKILRTFSIPGVTMMPFNTEKRYDSDLKNFRICEKTGYPELASQIRTIKSMNMPFVMVDNLLHRGYRMIKIGESLSAEGLKADSIIVGLCSDAGREIAAKTGCSVDPVYEVPDIRLWMIESDMTPFISGDKVDRFEESSGYGPEDLPSIYPMLPYQLPSFFRGAPYHAVYQVSKTCLENSLRLFETLEALYREKYGRKLTLRKISEVIDEPGYPEGFSEWTSADYMQVSQLIKHELIRLERFNRNI